MKIPLSHRLQSCCAFVNPGDRVADIGCDHGYLGIHLLKTGVARSVIASDVREGPLQAAVHNAAKFGVRDQMSFYLSDGVRNIPRDFDCLVCAGMGADTMISILGNAPWLADPRYRLILQCQSKQPELRLWLSQNGYRICQEVLAKDGKFVYSIMEVVCGPGEAIVPWEAYLSRSLLENPSALLGEYYSRIKQGLALTVSGLEWADSPLHTHYQAILSDLTALEDQIYGDRT